jgi:uncharacterized membrane protein
MNKKIFIDELRKYLIANDIEDVAEITAEYEDHFMRKAADGYSEDEISAKLGNPKDRRRI